MSQEKYIGMDVHQATISAAVMDAHGKLLMECLLETKASTISCSRLILPQNPFATIALPGDSSGHCDSILATKASVTQRPTQVRYFRFAYSVLAPGWGCRGRRLSSTGDYLRTKKDGAGAECRNPETDFIETPGFARQEPCSGTLWL